MKKIQKSDSNIESGFIMAIQKYYFYVLKIFFNDKIKEENIIEIIIELMIENFTFFIVMIMIMFLYFLISLFL